MKIPNNLELIEASMNGDIGTAELLVSYGMDINFDDGYAIEVATEYNQLDYIKYLVNNLKANPKIIKDNRHIILAAENARYDMLTFFLSKDRYPVETIIEAVKILDKIKGAEKMVNTILVMYKLKINRPKKVFVNVRPPR